MSGAGQGTRPLRVLMLNERDLGHPLAGGVEVHLEETGMRLARDHGIETTVLCAGFAGCTPEEARGGMRFLRLGRNRVEYYASVPGRARALLRRGEHDLLVENLCKLVFLSPLWAGPVPGLGLVHHLFGRSAFRQVAFPTALAVLATEASLPLLYRRWPFVAVSPSTREDLLRRGLSRERIRVVPNGIDHELYRPDPRVVAEAEHVVFVGRIEHYKGLDVLLAAWPAVTAARPGARLSILGAGSALDEMRRRVADARLRGVVFDGFVDDRTKVDRMRRASIVVQPSRKEGWGLTVLEANACGTPVVATDVPGLRDSVRPGETGLLVPSADPAALADGLLRLLGDREFCIRLADGALAWSARFTWERAASSRAGLLRAAATRASLPEPPDLLGPIGANEAAGARRPA